MFRSFTFALATLSLVLLLSIFAPSSLAAETERPSTNPTITSWFGAVQDLVVGFWKTLFSPEVGEEIADRSGTGGLDDYGFESTGGGEDDEYGPYADPTGSRGP